MDPRYPGGPSGPAKNLVYFPLRYKINLTLFYRFIVQCLIATIVAFKIMFEFSTFISSHIIYNFSSVFPQCMHFLTLNKSRQCKFIKTQLTCQMSDGFFQYLQFPYCQLSSVPEVAFILLVSVSSWLCTCILSCLLGGGILN